MSDIKLFQINGPEVRDLVGQSVAVEKSLQTLTEKHLESFFGVRFLASEYSTGKTHGGRIDTLGLDENGCPVIIEYKRALNENVINQGLFYLDWLLDHKGEFTLLVLKRFGQQAADSIEWSSPRLMCIAGDFTRYDEHAVQHANQHWMLVGFALFARLRQEWECLEVFPQATAAILGAARKHKTSAEESYHTTENDSPVHSLAGSPRGFCAPTGELWQPSRLPRCLLGCMDSRSRR